MQDIIGLKTSQFSDLLFASLMRDDIPWDSTLIEGITGVCFSTRS